MSGWRFPEGLYRASCESPWHILAKRCLLGACFPLTAPFRTCCSPCEMVRTAYVQRLMGCLYTPWDSSIPMDRLHGTPYGLPTRRADTVSGWSDRPRRHG